MKYFKTLLIVAFMLFLAGCGNEVIISNCTLIIEIENDEIFAGDIKGVYVNGESAAPMRSGKLLTFDFFDTTRKMITLTLPGYIPQNIIVRSADYDDNLAYTRIVRFEKAYVLLQLTLFTDAAPETINIKCDDIISLSVKNNIYEVKLKKEGTHEVTVSTTEEGYPAVTLTLTPDEIDREIIARVVPFLSDEYTVIEFDGGGIYYVNAQTNSPQKIKSYTSGNSYILGLPKDGDARVGVYDLDWQEVGYVDYTSGQLNDADYYTLEIGELTKRYMFSVIPYRGSEALGNYWHVIVKKKDEQYNALAVNWSAAELYPICLDTSNDIYIASLGGDGKIRIKSIDTDAAVFVNREWRLDIVFDGTEDIIDFTLIMVDFNGVINDFSGTVIFAGNEEIGVIEEGASLPVRANGSYTYFSAGNLPDGYEAAGCYNMLDRDSLSDIVTKQVYYFTIFKPFDLYVNFTGIKEINEVRSHDGTIYAVDEHRRAVISNFNFNEYYALVANGVSFGNLLEELGGINNIKKNENGDYYVNIDINEPD